MKGLPEDSLIEIEKKKREGGGGFGSQLELLNLFGGR